MDVTLRKQLASQITGAGFSARKLDWLLELGALILIADSSIDHFDLLDAALKQPQLFSRKPETLNDNVERSAALLGLTKQQFAAAALKQPPLFCQKPETLNGNVEQSAALLGLTKQQFAAAALKQPQLFCQKPETLNGNVERSAALLGLTKQQFAAAALKQPSLFCQKPETLNRNVEQSAALLGVTKEQLAAAALKQPSLFYQKPETLNRNVEQSAALLGLTKQQFIAAALKQLSLLYQKPETLNGKKLYIIKIAEELGGVNDFATFIQSAPVALACGVNHLHTRYVLAKLHLKRGSLSTLVMMPSVKASALIVDHFTKQITRTGAGVRALQVMHAQGLIATLPVGITAIERPPHRPRHEAGVNAATIC